MPPPQKKNHSGKKILILNKGNLLQLFVWFMTLHYYARGTCRSAHSFHSQLGGCLQVDNGVQTYQAMWGFMHSHGVLGGVVLGRGLVQLYLLFLLGSNYGRIFS